MQKGGISKYSNFTFFEIETLFLVENKILTKNGRKIFFCTFFRIFTFWFFDFGQFLVKSENDFQD